VGAEAPSRGAGAVDGSEERGAAGLPERHEVPDDPQQGSAGGAVQERQRGEEDLLRLRCLGATAHLDRARRLVRRHRPVPLDHRHERADSSPSSGPW
jgi:hypothetical protein